MGVAHRRAPDRAGPVSSAAPSHILKVMRDQALELVHMNPGACGHNGWHVVRTLLLTVEGGKITLRGLNGIP